MRITKEQAELAFEWLKRERRLKPVGFSHFEIVKDVDTDYSIVMWVKDPHAQTQAFTIMGCIVRPRVIHGGKS